MEDSEPTTSKILGGLPRAGSPHAPGRRSYLPALANAGLEHRVHCGSPAAACVQIIRGAEGPSRAVGDPKNALALKPRRSSLRSPGRDRTMLQEALPAARQSCPGWRMLYRSRQRERPGLFGVHLPAEDAHPPTWQRLRHAGGNVRLVAHIDQSSLDHRLSSF